MKSRDASHREMHTMTVHLDAGRCESRKPVAVPNPVVAIVLPVAKAAMVVFGEEHHDAVLRCAESHAAERHGLEYPVVARAS